MGLTKTEFAGAQAQLHTEIGYGLQGEVGYWQGFAGADANEQFYDAAVSNDVEDPEIEAIYMQQDKECFEATLRLNALEAQSERKAGAGGSGKANSSSSSSSSNEESHEESVTEEALSQFKSRTETKIPQSLASLPSAPKEPVKLPYEKLLKLLLASLKGSFAPNIPRQKCASPVPYNTKTRGYSPMFYVSKERKLTKNDEAFDGIPVRYQGFTKSTIWFSPENPRWGIVARRMQHQSRMKQKNAGIEQNMAGKAASFFQVFEGFSYVLIERQSPDEEISKSNLANYVVENAAKFVQVWPLSKASPNHQSGLPSSINLPHNRFSSSSSSSSGDSPVNSPRGSATQPSSPVTSSGKNPAHSSSASSNKAVSKPVIKLERSGSHKRSFDSVSNEGSLAFARESKRQHVNEDFAPWLSTFEPEFPAFATDHGSIHSSHSDETSNRSANRLSRSCSSTSTSLYNSHGGQWMGSPRNAPDETIERLDCDLLLGEALLTGEDDFLSHASGETTLQDLFIDESDDGFGGSHDPFGVMLCDSIFKRFCDNMEGNQFAREYERVQSLLFNRNFSQSLRAAIGNKDPRITQEFMLPELSSPNARFVPGLPVGTLRMVETQVGSSDYVVETCDSQAEEILQKKPVGVSNLFDKLDPSDKGYIMAKYYWLENKPNNFWFQRVVTLGKGHAQRAAVLRGFVTLSGCPSSGKAAVGVRFQDVSKLYRELLELPATDLI